MISDIIGPNQVLTCHLALRLLIKEEMLEEIICLPFECLLIIS
jgi:hypothetical protein